MTLTPDHTNPPIAELVLCAQFSPLTKLSSGHFGLFWKELGDEWTEPGDGLPIPDQFELFDRPRPIGIQLSLMPMNLPGRFTLGHKSKDRLLQIQSTRFCLNWRKQKEFYPSYKSLIDEFKEMFARFSSFSRRQWAGDFGHQSVGIVLHRCLCEGRILEHSGRVGQISARLVRSAVSSRWSGHSSRAPSGRVEL